MAEMSTPALGALITECWLTAEQEMRRIVREKHPDSDEEMITNLFQGELRVATEAASSSGAIAAAFMDDISINFPNLDHGFSGDISNGLVATVTFHSREVETLTGGDIGIVAIRPDLHWLRRSQLAIRHGYRRGLLCQGKMFRRDSKWGRLRRNQRATLRGKLKYAALLLYRYVDQNGERRDLSPFHWQLAEGLRVGQLDECLKSDSFPTVRESRAVLSALFDAQIGTDDDRIIDRDIAPPVRPSLIIRVGWKDGVGPGQTIYVRERPKREEERHVLLARR